MMICPLLAFAVEKSNQPMVCENPAGSHDYHAMPRPFIPPRLMP
jgi:hypothetical protein